MTAPFTGRYVFVGGLHRSGTSLLTRLVAGHDDVREIRDAPVPEQEGVYLQGAIPHTAEHGIPGQFAFDPAQHHIEGGPFDTLATKQRIEADWQPWYDDGGAWRIEKSPVNLLRMRLYQQLFPLAHFIMVVRHPAAVTQATAKWTDVAPEHLLRHWQVAYTHALGDASYLHHLLIVRYEDLCADPAKELKRVFAFLDLNQALAPSPPSLRDGNADYHPLPDLELPPIARRLGYGDGFGSRIPIRADIACRHPLRQRRVAISKVV